MNKILQDTEPFFMNYSDLLMSGKASFSYEVPYRLFRTGSPEQQPLFVYLHENGLNLTQLEKKINPLLHIEGYHLLIQAPYPDIKQPDDERAYYWIPQYQEEQAAGAAREYVSEFLQEVIDNLLQHIKPERLVLVGWEGSRHQFSFFCATRPHYVNEIILFGGSVNRLWMDEKSTRYKHLRVLGLTGKDSEITDHTGKTILDWIKNR